jgi:hypothetical protein
MADNSVRVQVNSQRNTRVNTLNYGIRTIKGSSDLSMNSPHTGDVIIYDADTHSFTVSPLIATVTDIDAGQF